MTRPERNPFELPAEPRGGLDLIWWVLFEYRRLERYGKTLDRRRSLRIYLSAVLWTSLLATGVWLLGSLLVVLLEVRFPGICRIHWINALAFDETFAGRLLESMRSDLPSFLVELVVGGLGWLLVNLLMAVVIFFPLMFLGGLVAGPALALVGGIAWILTSIMGGRSTRSWSHRRNWSHSWNADWPGLGAASWSLF